MLMLSHFKGHAMGGFGGALKNMSIGVGSCDSNPEAPCMDDIGIVASLDPVAIDKASLDFVYHSEDKGKQRLIHRIEEKHGIRTVEHAEELGIGTTKYEIINID